MQFKETFLYYSFTKVKDNYFSMNLYSRILATPLAIFMIIVIFFGSIFIDGYQAISELL